ncbi:MAG: HIT family protein [Pseudomonadota bacterium]
MTSPFRLDPRLETETILLCETSCGLLLVNRDGRFPWVIYVPTQGDLADLVDLSDADQTAAMADVRSVSLELRSATGCDKLNIASLGNVVRQLHIHIIARFKTDEAWPGPVWGVGEPEPLEDLPRWANDVRTALVDTGWTPL